MNSLTKIRKAVFEDLGAILDLVRALARYEQAENAVTATLKIMKKTSWREFLRPWLRRIKTKESSVLLYII